ncbi:MAG: type II toxin-antitoxin system RelE/ParE family toxin [Bacteroidetes bacterium]|nr:type II toxin-antitoxin system RelE/ParE family toxin [Bacteroidota bacterium]
MISDESRLDILEAYSWYESRRPGLGNDFELCLEAGLNQIERNPLLFQKRYRQLHIHFIDRFPYGIHYLIDNDTVKVIGVFHTSMNPKRWIIRTKSK